jgi:hypothetical protein
MWPASNSNWTSDSSCLRGAHEYGEREREATSHTNIEKEREVGPPHKRTSMELTSYLRRREKPSQENEDGERERSTNPMRCTGENEVVV